MIIGYAVTATLALLLLVGHLVVVRPRNRWMLLLFVSITIANLGYLLLSVAERYQHLSFAVAANTVVYFGSVFLIPCLFMTVRQLCGATRLGWLKWCVIGTALLMFTVVATTPVSKLYYQDVMFDQNGLFDKIYGPLHPAYKVYIIGYFAAMVYTVLRSLRRHRFPSQKQAVIITVIVFGNVAFWLVEQVIPGPFEYMSAFYLFSEVMLLGLHWLMQDVETPAVPTVTASPMEILLARLPNGVVLHPREQEILEMILTNERRKEIAAALSLSENTVKTYTRNLYHKLGVSSREELFALLP